MELKWRDLDLNALKALYEAESAKLKKALSGGSSWEDTKEQRKKLMELSVALRQKINISDNPAESPGRSEKRVSR